MSNTENAIETITLKEFLWRFLMECGKFYIREVRKDVCRYEL